ncbi:alpha/beta hydrolase [Bradyrhizobium sp. LHD-71]|uniref:alpha/beta fold hydrolase n=1 Tax=Bradyrhizobium sp. LHD-71 TaxID=3072141 RepID=UPI00280FEB09|nr:alpha/beta hydrolase [Bradyrhizobium sp. LHD-71]MDQ8728611.1 alpha/beta hydrolase [Bradyrhizobium sp. LHD-71]
MPEASISPGKPAVWTPVPIPEQVPVKEGIAKLPGTSLWYWDTGGDGDAVVLLHAASGSGAFWGYQQPVLAKAGFRVISYSRRGYLKSDPGDRNDPGVASEDLQNLLGFLGVGKFHVIGLAAGGIVATDYALSYPERLKSLTLVSTIMGVTDKSYLDLCNIFRPAFFAQLPKDFQELSPSYRAGNPEGAAAWAALAKTSMIGERLNQKNANVITWDKVEAIKVPTLLMTGDSDLWTPPSVLRLQASHLTHAEVKVIKEAGHAPSWEQPEDFNAALLDFVRRNAT